VNLRSSCRTDALARFKAKPVNWGQAVVVTGFQATRARKLTTSEREPAGPWPLDAPSSSTAHRQSRNLGALHRPELAFGALKGYG
jgi:hypothetical protein